MIAPVTVTPGQFDYAPDSRIPPIAAEIHSVIALNGAARSADRYTDL
jgi:hypothetical protein